MASDVPTVLRTEVRVPSPYSYVFSSSFTRL